MEYIEVTPEGKWKYTPNQDYVGKDSFIVKVEYPDGATEDYLVELYTEKKWAVAK